MRISLLKDCLLGIGSGIDKGNILEYYQDIHNEMNKKFTKEQCIMVRKRITKI